MMPGPCIDVCAFVGAGTSSSLFQLSVVEKTLSQSTHLVSKWALQWREWADWTLESPGEQFCCLGQQVNRLTAVSVGADQKPGFTGVVMAPVGQPWVLSL